jgi:hypothetical protein
LMGCRRKRTGDLHCFPTTGIKIHETQQVRAFLCLFLLTD